MDENIGYSILDGQGSGKRASVIETSEPMINALVISNPDGTDITSNLQALEYQIAELTSRLSVLASMSDGKNSLRVVQAVAGLTQAVSVSNATIAAIGGMPSTVMQWAYTNPVAIQSNINNCVVV